MIKAPQPEKHGKPSDTYVQIDYRPLAWWKKLLIIAGAVVMGLTATLVITRCSFGWTPEITINVVHSFKGPLYLIEHNQ